MKGVDISHAMHHHHPPTTAGNAPATISSVPNPTPTINSATHAQQQRRRKKRPNYGTRTVEVRRGYNGFGFTISGQQPCRLSCIITNSPADQAGLRAGDFLISVNGLNVSKLPHETVVQLIGNSFGSIRMQIAENYYSDSSDEENAALMLQQQATVGNANTMSSQLGLLASGGARAKPRYLHHKTKMHRLRNSPQKKRIATRPQFVSSVAAAATTNTLQPMEQQTLRPLMEDLPLTMQGICTGGATYRSPSKATPAASVASSNVANVSAMVRVPTAALEYRAIVGYLGTIEMPKQISHSSKLQTVRSCIRKLRQEKRQPTTVLMTILPDCLRLQAANGSTLASYASARLNYVSSSSESENRFFGLVTSAVHTSQADDDDDEEEDEIENAQGKVKPNTGHISISNSCHVFVIDTKLCDHQAHVPRANEFRIQCTKDPISNLCLEFPINSEYVVNLIRSMYTMRILPPATRHNVDDGAQAAGAAAAHSPQPSNHSEISTTTSNSDSGIGFHNDTNVSDRIVVVDFPGAPELRMRPAGARPLGIFNNLDAVANASAGGSSDKRLTVRAMPDPKTPHAAAGHVRPNLLANFNLIKSPASSLTTTRSCDDVLALVEHDDDDADHLLLSHASMDDISLHSATTTALMEEEHTFLHPSCLAARATVNVSHYGRKSSAADTYMLLQDCRSGARNSRHSLQLPLTTTTTTGVLSKLSPQVFARCAPLVKAPLKQQPASSVRHSLGFPAIDSSRAALQNVVASPRTLNFDLDTWRSLQDLNSPTQERSFRTPTKRIMEATNSVPDLANRALPANASPFRRAWGQSSFRTPHTEKHTNHHLSPLVRRAASMTASDNDVYIKSMHGYIDELKQTHSQQQIATNVGAAGAVKARGNHVTTANATAGSKLLPNKTDAPQAVAQAGVTAANNGAPGGVITWGTSFEQLLLDPTGLRTFAEFLKKEFSAENIYFWTACERFRNTENVADRVTQAMAIFAKHLSKDSHEPVNVDSQARNLSEEELKSGALGIFAHAQKQIFNLMKFDSYHRFIRSDLYKSCLEAEEKRQPLPYANEELDDLLKTHTQQSNSSAMSKLKKSASNAEDRCRKSLLPWHRKISSSKSRERAANDCDADKPTPSTSSKLPLLSGSSLKIPSTHSNSVSDIHSSRSSLSSFDALPGALCTTASSGQLAETVCSLCRVILSDGATTIVQTRAGETVGQLVERLLEKRGLTYQYYDVVANGSSKSIDLQSPSLGLAGKEVLIEQRVAFKLDLPDPKVISVKSRPKKQLHEVIRPILHKYNYTMEAVQVLMRDTHSLLDLSLPVTAVDGQRLQIVLLKPPTALTDYQNGCGVKFPKPMLPKGVAKQLQSAGAAAVAARNGAAQNKLDEITNKVFNELLQGKVEAHANEKLLPTDACSLKSDDCASETSSLFDRMRRRDSNTPALRLCLKKKSTSSQNSEEAQHNGGAMAAAVAVTTAIALAQPTSADLKKPIIAKLKAGVKLQVTERVAENQDELLEGLKRAQLARLEDQRGTEINFELPDFLKNKENLSAAASKLRKVRANLSPINKSFTTTPDDISLTPPHGERPQPAPRLSITNRNKLSASATPMKIDEEPPTTPPAAIEPQQAADTSNSSMESSVAADFGAGGKGPPPLPPKPKVLPIKPSNWGVCSNASGSPVVTPTALTPTKNYTSVLVTPPAESGARKSLLGATDQPASRFAYLEEPSSSFV